MENQEKTAIVTGAYGAIGLAISRAIASKGYKLTLVGRDENKLKSAVSEIQQSTPNKDVSYHKVDLSVKHKIEAFAQSWNKPLDLLINNAAATPRSREETSEGIEMQFATNVLGYFWMTQFFYPYMKNRDDARIVYVASYWAGDLQLDDLEFTKRPYNNDTAYRQTKQANRMLTAAFAMRLPDIAVLAAHPGDVNSRLSNNLGYGGWETPDQGADTPVYCATSADLKNVTGKYFEHRVPVDCPFVKDQKAVEKLYDTCLSY